MIQFLSIFSDVMRIATFQWHGQGQHAKCREEPTRPGRWTPSVERQAFRRTCPCQQGGEGTGIAFS